VLLLLVLDLPHGPLGPGLYAFFSIDYAWIYFPCVRDIPNCWYAVDDSPRLVCSRFFPTRFHLNMHRLRMNLSLVTRLVPPRPRTARGFSVSIFPVRGCTKSALCKCSDTRCEYLPTASAAFLGLPTSPSILHTVLARCPFYLASGLSAPWH
jgi:hypothetical protein